MVVNEIGEIPVDGKVMEESGMKVKDIGGGCICCEVASTFAKSLGQLARDFDPDIVLVEPTGVAIPHQVKAAAAMGARSTTIDMGPVIVLFDATRPDELLDMELMGRLVTSQLVDADIVAVSKVDAVDEAHVEHAIEDARRGHPRRRVHPASRRCTGEGLESRGRRGSWEERAMQVTTPAIWTTGSAATGWPSSSTGTNPWRRPKWATCCAR